MKLKILTELFSYRQIQIFLFALLNPRHCRFLIAAGELGAVPFKSIFPSCRKLTRHESTTRIAPTLQHPFTQIPAA
jgi:hypothetical protein